MNIIYEFVSNNWISDRREGTVFIMKLSDGEKIIISMLYHIHKKLGIEEESDAEFIHESILSGNLWAIKIQLSGLFDKQNSSAEVDETLSILYMWFCIESSFNSLSPEDQAMISEATNSKTVEFPGFSHNCEPHYEIAKYIINSLDRYTEFASRDLRCPAPTLLKYKKMLEVFDKYNKPNIPLSSDMIINILNAA